MHDLKFFEVSQIKPLPASDCTIEPLPEIYHNFLENFAVVAWMKEFPGYTFWAGTKFDKAELQAQTDIIGSHRKAQTDVEEKKVAAKTAFYMAKALNVPAKDWCRNVAGNTLRFEGVVAHTGKHIHAIVHNLLKGIIVQSCTALEVLIADLFRKTRDKYGALMEAKKNATFGSRFNFRAAYNTAFNDASINTALNHESIDALSLLRNAIVHNAGVVDDSFMNSIPNTKGYPGYPLCALLQQQIPGLNVGAEIPLDGERVKEIVNPAMNQGYQLVVALEQWLKPRI